MPYAPLYGPWWPDATDDASTPGGMQGAAYPFDWTMPVSGTAATAASAGPQLAAPPQPAPPTGATTPPSAATPNDTSTPPTGSAISAAVSEGLPWWLVAALEPGGSPLARAPLVTPDWVASRSLVGLIGQRPGLFPFPPGSDEPPPSAWQSVPFNITRPQLSTLPSADAQPPSPPRSVLFTGAPPQTGALPPDQASDSDDSDRNVADLAAPGLPLSKSGAPFFPPAPDRVFSINPPSWLDVANSIAPNIVDYFTKPVPPQAPFPSAPGKIPSANFNPYAGPALVDATNLATMLLPGAGIADGIADRVAMMGAKALQGQALAGTTLARGIAAIGREGEAAVGIPANAPKPRILITSSGAYRFPDQLTDRTLEEVKNVGYLAFTQQLMDYLEYAQENDLTFILHTRPNTKFSGTLQRMIDSGQIQREDIKRLPK